MDVIKQDDGQWAVRDDQGNVVGVLDGRYSDWVARADGKTLGVCKSRRTAEILVRAYLRGGFSRYFSGS